MKSKKGLTLIEVVVSLAILGIISVAFLTSISSHFSYLNKTKGITQRAFLAQREMEKEIDTLKDKINNNELILKETKIFKNLVSEGIKVKYVEVKKDYGTKQYYSLVSDVKPDIFNPLKLEKIESNIFKNTKKVPYGYGTGLFDLVGEYTNKDKDENGKNIKYDHMLTIIEWYVSTDNFILPMPKGAGFNLEDDIIFNSYYYPLFPRDYVLISNDVVYDFGTKNIKLEDLSKYSGRHIIFTATPAAKSGKIGIQGVTNPLFVSRLPVTDGLMVHLDAAYIDAFDTNMVDKSSGNIRVKSWPDISSILYRDSVNEFAQQSNSGKRPELLKTDMGVGFIGQFVRFENGKTLDFSNSETNNNKYVLAVIRNRSTNQEPIFLRNYSENMSIPLEPEEIENEWVLVEKEYTLNNNIFIIGNENVDIAEILVYSNKPSDENIVKVKEYINEKYKTPMISGDIAKLIDVDMEIMKGQNFYLPSVVLAEMNDGSEKYVSVMWSGLFDVNTVGVYELTGTSTDNPLKKMKYILNVTEN